MQVHYRSLRANAVDYDVCIAIYVEVTHDLNQEN